MATTTLPGLKAEHLVISAKCIETHGDLGALDIAFEKLKKQYLMLVDVWGEQEGFEIHLAATIMRPGRDDK